MRSLTCNRRIRQARFWWKSARRHFFRLPDLMDVSPESFIEAFETALRDAGLTESVRVDLSANGWTAVWLDYVEVNSHLVAPSSVLSERTEIARALHKTLPAPQLRYTEAAQNRSVILPQPSKGMTMSTQNPINPVTRSFRRLLFNRSTVLAFVAGAAVAVGIGVSAQGAGMGAWHHGSMMDGTHSAADVSAHVDHMLKHFYVEIDATDAQKAQIDPLVKQAVNDLLPLHTQIHAAHEHAMQALTQTAVDRPSLEAARLEHLQLADQASKRLVQLLADVGDILTPTQRKALTDHLQHMHGMKHP
jgi:periplasmic protein CpxP/Spy